MEGFETLCQACFFHNETKMQAHGEFGNINFLCSRNVFCFHSTDKDKVLVLPRVSDEELLWAIAYQGYDDNDRGEVARQR